MGHTRLFRLCFLIIVLSVASLGSLSCSRRNRRAVISSISPDSATAGGDQFVLAVNGSYFVPNSRVVWNGFPVVTAYVNSNELLAEIPASDVAVAGTALVFVFNPPGSSTYVFGFTPMLGTCLSQQPIPATEGKAHFLTPNISAPLRHRTAWRCLGTVSAG